MLVVAGKLVMCRVYGIAYKRPQGEQLDQANPVRNEESGLWQCPFCLNSDFPELSEVSATLPDCQQSLALIVNLLSMPCFQSAVTGLNCQPFVSATLSASGH